MAFTNLITLHGIPVVLFSTWLLYSESIKDASLISTTILNTLTTPHKNLFFSKSDALF